MNDLRITYPHMNRKSLFEYRSRQVLRWLLLFAAIICPVVNFFTGGPLWSVVVIWAVIFVWNTLLSPDVLEFSALSALFRTSTYTLILLTLIGLLLSPGWLGFVLPIVGFGTLSVSALLFLVNFSKHKTDAMPLIFETLAALIAFIVVWATTGVLNWPMKVMGSMSFFFIVFGLIAFHRSIWSEIKKRLHTR